MIVRYTGPDIIELRKRNGWTQRELALALCDVPPDQWDRLKEALSTLDVVRKWEQGERLPSPAYQRKLEQIDQETDR